MTDKQKVKTISEGWDWCLLETNARPEARGQDHPARKLLIDIVEDILEEREKKEYGKQGLHIAVKLYNHLHNAHFHMVLNKLVRGDYTYKLAFRVMKLAGYKVKIT